ncbi:hypothetical protein JHK85_057204 [Glycine max]|nr:hypothetical protein JHK85_057204 [Glycine max]
MHQLQHHSLPLIRLPRPLEKKRSPRQITAVAGWRSSPRWPPQKEAIAWFDPCMLRYTIYGLLQCETKLY